MSILNRASDGLFNVLIVLYTVVHESKSIQRDRLISKCAPGLIDQEKVRQTLIRWIQLGLFQISTEEEVSIAEEYQLDRNRKWEISLLNLPNLIRRVVFDDQNNQNFWDSEKSLSADFTRGVAWLLAQDVYAFSSQNFSTIETLESSQIKDKTKRVVVNNTRWDGLKEWAAFLGFGWNADSFVVDPTGAVCDVLPDIFGDANVLSIDRFLDRLSTVLPVMDGGKYRLQIETELNPSSWHKNREDHLSTSLSRVLKRLDFSGHIRIERKSDSKMAFHLSTGGGESWGDPITHVALITRG